MNQKQTPRIYLAGPEVFLPEDERLEVLASKKDILSSLGMVGVDPVDNGVTISDDISPADTALRIYRSNVAHIKACDGSLVNLTPFRGLSADAGTVFEVGYLAALGKPMIGYTLWPGDFKTRFDDYWGDAGSEDTLLLDRNGHSVEDFGQVDNLMIESAILTNGGAVFRADECFSEGQLYSADLFERAANALLGQLKSRGFNL